MHDYYKDDTYIRQHRQELMQEAQNERLIRLARAERRDARLLALRHLFRRMTNDLRCHLAGWWWRTRNRTMVRTAEAQCP